MATGRLPDPNTAPLTAKGDLYTYSTVPARLAVGSNGDTLVADSSASTGLRWTATPSASNPVLNSAYQIWQRGTSVSATNQTAYTADRWMVATGASMTCTISRQATGDSTNLPFIQYCARVQRNSGQTATGNWSFQQSMESINSIPFAGKTVTLSFYARKGANFSASGDLLAVGFYSGTGTDQNFQSGYTGTTNIVNTTQAITSTWVRYSFTGSVSATATELALVFSYTATGTAGAADYYEITGVQIDVGSVALPFRTYSATLAGELAACQRYYYRMSSSASSSYARFSGAAAADNTIFVACPVFFPVTMRVKPTSIEGANLTIYGGGFPASVTSVVLAGDSTETVGLLGVNGTGFTQFRTYNVLANNSSSAYVAFNAEL